MDINNNNTFLNDILDNSRENLMSLTQILKEKGVFTHLVVNDMYVLLSFGTFLFIIGLIGTVVARYNFLVVLMFLEMSLFGLTIDFVSISYILGDVVGNFFALLILTLAAAEASIAMAIFLNIYKALKNISMKKIRRTFG
jgi:NADH-quinone oxidoreductase subunit K